MKGARENEWNNNDDDVWNVKKNRGGVYNYVKKSTRSRKGMDFWRR